MNYLDVKDVLSPYKFALQLLRFLLACGSECNSECGSVWRLCCCIAGVSRLIDSWVGPLGAPQTQLLPCRGRSTSHTALVTSGHACTAHLGSGAPSDAMALCSLVARGRTFTSDT
jgi:hypothetical protein